MTRCQGRSEKGVWSERLDGRATPARRRTRQRDANGRSGRSHARHRPGWAPLRAVAARPPDGRAGWCGNGVMPPCGATLSATVCSWNVVVLVFAVLGLGVVIAMIVVMVAVLVVTVAVMMAVTCEGEPRTTGRCGRAHDRRPRGDGPRRRPEGRSWRQRRPPPAPRPGGTSSVLRIRNSPGRWMGSHVAMPSAVSGRPTTGGSGDGTRRRDGRQSGDVRWLFAWYAASLCGKAPYAPLPPDALPPLRRRPAGPWRPRRSRCRDRPDRVVPRRDRHASLPGAVLPCTFDFTQSGSTFDPHLVSCSIRPTLSTTGHHQDVARHFSLSGSVPIVCPTLSVTVWRPRTATASRASSLCSDGASRLPAASPAAGAATASWMPVRPARTATGRRATAVAPPASWPRPAPRAPRTGTSAAATSAMRRAAARTRTARRRAMMGVRAPRARLQRGLLYRRLPAQRDGMQRRRRLHAHRYLQRRRHMRAGGYAHCGPCMAASP